MSEGVACAVFGGSSDVVVSVIYDEGELEAIDREVDVDRDRVAHHQGDVHVYKYARERSANIKEYRRGILDRVDDDGLSRSCSRDTLVILSVSDLTKSRF